MGRGRMELIKKEKNRMITFQKRKEGLMKKAYELSTLCGIDVCVIIYAPHFNDQGSQLQTWPKDTKEVNRIIEKYKDTTIDRSPKIYDVQEYYKDRVKKVESEIAKVRREKLKIMYPTWDESFNVMGEQQLRMFVTMLDNKLDVCNQRINVLKQDHKGRVITEEAPFKSEICEGQVYGPSHMKQDSDNKNHIPFYTFNHGQNSQSSMLHFDQNMQTMLWPYDTSMQTPNNSQNLQNEAAFQIQPQGFQINGFYDTNALQSQMLNYMHGWNNRQ
ncbi:hypothetical protein TanjilG_05385 [Lupinus angustifolius]|uniref:MADS-box domain-containing protein n=1 Tax=Lupinus angustifolius TaxID=3871 RepID=A0A1J7HQ12_LUPAN|nr:PREDICTED: agamous-like MADS-box protein AGL82 [Lupinus angustifolius]OIW14764.1 hypothetical protein TanjilG_05385 [Lupinus angustifolius]